MTLCKSKAYERFWPKFKTLAGLSRAKKKKKLIKTFANKKKKREG